MAISGLHIKAWTRSSRINGIEVTGDPMALADWLVDVAERSHELDAATNEFEVWLRENVKPR